VYSTEARRRLGSLLDRVRPDACHAHNIYHHLSPSILGLLHERGVPTVLTLHDLKIACPAYTMLSNGEVCERCRGGRIHNVLVHRCIKGSVALSAIAMVEAAVHAVLGSYRRVTRFVVPSRFYAAKLVEWGLAPERFTYVPNFVDAAACEPRYAPGNAFLYFGRLAPEKGLATLVRAAALADVPVVLAGTGPESERLERLATACGARVRFAGYLGGSALHEVIRDARAVVLPSEWYENAPLSVLEAYAFGKPVLGARIGGIPELIREGETGATFASGDVNDLAARLREYATLPDAEVAAQGAAARAYVAEEFSLARYRERILALYREIGVPA
jgi:glycosyltransferase involved in cell wall biosynthesis